MQIKVHHFTSWKLSFSVEALYIYICGNLFFCHFHKTSGEKRINAAVCRSLQHAFSATCWWIGYTCRHVSACRLVPVHSSHERRGDDTCCPLPPGKSLQGDEWPLAWWVDTLIAGLLNYIMKWLIHRLPEWVLLNINMFLRENIASKCRRMVLLFRTKI